MKKLILYSCFCISLSGYAQQKYEREYKIDTNEVPQQALDFIAAFKVHKKVKWYQEQGLDETSVEAKFKLKGAKYSVEFGDDGTLQDIEQTVAFKKLPTAIQESIQLYLNEQYDAYSIEKVQLQYTGNPKVLLPWIQSTSFPTLDITHKNITRIYELVVRTRTKSNVLLFQFQFDDEGQKIEQKEIITRDTDILKF